MTGIFAIQEVLKQTGLSYRQLDNLARKGLFRPSVAQAAGPGSRRLYDSRDLFVLRAIAILRRMGIGRSTFNSLLKAVQSTGLPDGDERRRFVVQSGNKTTVVDATGLGKLVNEPRNVTIVVPLALLAKRRP